MKVYVKEKFKPVYIVLDSQEEVDMLFSVVNFSPIKEALDAHDGVMGTFGMLHGELEVHSSQGYKKFHKSLDKYLRRA